MNFKAAIVLMSLLFITGCGSFHHLEQTYYVKESSIQVGNRPQPRLNAQIVPSVENSTIPFIVHSRKWHGPYRVLLQADSKSTVCTYYLLHSLRVWLENDLVDEQIYPKPLKLDLCGDTIGNRNNHPLYHHDLGDSLLFEKGKKVALEVIYSQADSRKKRTLSMTGIGEEEQTRHSLWEAYMGI